MLDSKQYCIKEIENIKDLFTVIYTVIDDIYQQIVPIDIKHRRNSGSLKMSDSEIITIRLVGELFTIDSEKAWFEFCKKNQRDLFPDFCDRTRFNRTCRNLHRVMEIIRKEIAKITGYVYQSYRIIDSLPLPVCKFGRAHFHKTFRGYEATYGKCPSKKETYLGYKLHLLVSFDGFITDFTITPANIDDRAATWDLVEPYQKITILGDKGYISSDLGSELKAEKAINLLPLPKNHSKIQWPKAIRQLIFKLRRRIETSGSQLTNQLNIERVLAKSYWGFISRIQTKILAHCLCYFINMLIGHSMQFSKIKHLVFG